jgi:hypothetical protein
MVRRAQGGGCLLEGDSQRVDVAGQLSAFVRDDLVGCGLSRVDALPDGVVVVWRCRLFARGLDPSLR